MNNKKIMKKNQQGFTLIELLVVIAIIGLLATMSVIALGSAREKARDSRRLSDVKQIQTALEMYYTASGSYPSALGTEIIAGGNTFMGNVPTNPTPRTDGTCPDSDYGYTQTESGNAYTIQYCIGSATQEISGGLHCATPAGIIAGDQGTTGCTP